MEEMRKQAEVVGTNFKSDMIKEVNFKKSPFELLGESGNKYTAETVIIATGAQARWLNLDSEKKYRGFGVSACATCDGFFYKDKEVIVVGGGNAAVEEALFLTKFASKVTLIHRRDSLRAEKLLQQKILSHPKIKIIWNNKIKEIIGTENPKGVTSVVIENTKDQSISKIDTHGIFVAIGHDPATKIFANQIEMDDEGYIITKPDSTKTNIKGVFAAGDVKDKTYRQAVTAAGMGCMAALEAEKFLSENN
jgi:thioredoxin reductase (NADPH)